jgi:hypothetical protein
MISSVLNLQGRSCPSMVHILGTTAAVSTTSTEFQGSVVMHPWQPTSSESHTTTSINTCSLGC